MWPFTRESGKAMRDTPPEGINDFASYTSQPGSNGTEAAGFDNGSAPVVGSRYFPTIAEQNKVLVHWDRPPGDQNPAEWYADRNIWADEQSRIEKVDPLPGKVTTGQPSGVGGNPYWSPPTVQRPTAFMSPAGYSYTRPFDQWTEHELNGYHFSMADVNTGYMVGEMAPPPEWNNTYRLDAPNNDASSLHSGPKADLAVAVHLASTSDYWSNRSYRVGG